MKRTLFFLPALLVSLGLAAPAAHATLMMRIDDLSTAGVDVEITDTDGDGLLSFGSIGFGTWTLASAIGASYPALSNPPHGSMDLGSFDISGAGGGTLVVSLTDTFTRTNSQFNAFVGGVTDGTVSFATYISESNTAFDTSTLLSSLGGYSTGSFSGADWAGITVDNPYSLTMVATINHTGHGSTSFNYRIKVPEPGPLALFGIGLVALATVKRRTKT